MQINKIINNFLNLCFYEINIKFNLSDAFFEIFPETKKYHYNCVDFSQLLNSDSPLELYKFVFNFNGVAVIFCPFISGLLILFLYKKINESKILFITSFWNLSSILFLFSFFFSNFKNHKISVIKMFDFIGIFDFNIPFDIAIDPLTFIMMFIVNFISFCVITFAFWYMKGDPNFLKFVAFLNFFSFFMLLLVAANNLVLIFVGWEGIGLFSYFLINFWNTRLNANRSALKAIILNKVGDCFFYFFIFLYFFIFESVSLFDVKNLFNSHTYDSDVIMQTKLVHVMLFSIVIAAMAKSAQVILHVWLPDAMEGPTPVSALLHAATMVTAGVYVLIKFNWLVFYSESIYCSIILVGIFTNLLASLTALFQHDIKKIIAYSTASQLGLIFIAFGTLKFNLALFHIYNHAFFKALLFILAGIIIHNLFNNQDLRNILFLKNNLFFVYAILIISTLTLIGFPYLSAFYSKDFIINYAFINININKSAVVFFLSISVATTFLYAFKIINFLFFNEQITTFSSIYKENFCFGLFNKVSYLNLIVYTLALFSIFVGYFSYVFFQNDFLNFTSNLIYEICLEKKYTFNFLEFSFLVIIFIIVYSIPVLTARFFVIKHELIFSFWWEVVNFFNKKTLFDNLYFYFAKLFLAVLNIQAFFLDKGIIEYVIISIVEFKNQLYTKVKNLYLNLRWYHYTFFLFVVLLDIYFLLIIPNMFLFVFVSFFITLKTPLLVKYVWNKIKNRWKF